MEANINVDSMFFLKRDIEVCISHVEDFLAGVGILPPISSFASETRFTPAQKAQSTIGYNLARARGVCMNPPQPP